VSKAVVGWRLGRAGKPSRAAATTSSGPRSASDLEKTVTLFTFQLNGADHQGEIRWGKTLSQDKFFHLGLSTKCPAECQNMTAGMRGGCPAVHTGVCQVISMQKAAEICRNRPWDKEQIGRRPDWSCQPLLPWWHKTFGGVPSPQQVA